MEIGFKEFKLGKIDMKVACLGPFGSFSSLITTHIFPDADIVFMQTYEAFHKLKNQELSYAVYPIENNIGGFVYDTIRSLYQTSKISIVDHEYLRIEQNLITKCSSVLDIDTIYSHPQAIAQCMNNIRNIEKQRRREINIVKVSSTSQGVIEASKIYNSAAIGSKIAAERYGIPILVNGFQDKTINTTRFGVFKLGSPQKPSIRDKTMFLIELDHKIGSLANLFNLINSLSINILSIESHPTGQEDGLWKYAFFVEIDGHAHSEPVRTLYKVIANRHIKGQIRKGRWIGSYPNKSELRF